MTSVYEIPCPSCKAPQGQPCVDRENGDAKAFCDSRHDRSRGILRLDLGAGGRPQEGYIDVDRAQVTPETIVCDLVSGVRWPFKDDSIEELWSSHFIEHIPADEVEVYKTVRTGKEVPGHGTVLSVKRVMKDRLFFFFDEAFRIIKPGGLFHITWPALKSSDAFRDPTHRRFIPLEFAHYLSKQGRTLMGLEHYEVDCNWLVVEESVRLHLAPHAEGRDPWTAYEQNGLWDVQKAYSLSLRAEK